MSGYRVDVQIAYIRTAYGEFDWDNENRSHIARHDVTPSEVEEVFSRKHEIERSTKDPNYFVAHGRVSLFNNRVHLPRWPDAARNRVHDESKV